MKELRDILKAFSNGTSDMALATIVDTLGSSYRKPGARMLILPDGRTVGSLSGGCLEEEVAQRAMAVMETGESTVFWMDTLKRFGCHGSIQIFIERIKPGNGFLRYLGQCMVERKPALAVVCVEPDPERSGSFPRSLAGRGRTGFEEVILPPIRLIVVGHSPGNEALLGFAHVLGWSALVVTPDELRDFVPDERTAVVIKNHHFGKDCVALKWALSQPVGYIGLVGSPKRREELVDAFLNDGGDPDDVERCEFHGPAGLDIGASLPEEVALSITAEIQAVIARHDGGFLSEKLPPIHFDDALCSAAVS